MIFDPLVVLIDMILCAVLVVVLYPAQMTARQLGSKSVSKRDYEVSVAVLAYKEEKHYRRMTNRLNTNTQTTILCGFAIKAVEVCPRKTIPGAQNTPWRIPRFTAMRIPAPNTS